MYRTNKIILRRFPFSPFRPVVVSGKRFKSSVVRRELFRVVWAAAGRLTIQEPSNQAGQHKLPNTNFHQLPEFRNPASIMIRR